MRLFAAVELPEAARAAVADRIDPAAWPAGSWVRSPNLHLTLAFFGETPEAKLAPLARELAAAARARPPVRARLAGAGAFPERGPIRVVWLGVEPAAELARIAGEVRAAAARAGVESDPKPFRSHVTLARCRRPWTAGLRARLAELAPSGTVAWNAGAAELLESTRGPEGARYASRARLEFAGGA